MLQEKLKEATKANHDTLESLMFVNQIMGGTLTLQQYKQILTTNYIVHKQIEASLVNGLSPGLADQLNIIQRHKLTALEQDMKELLMDEPATTTAPTDLAASDASILGALYVLEGATLGGNVIVKRLKVNPNLNNLNLAFHYYQVYGENLISYWKTFCQVLNQQPAETDDESVSAAQKTFGYIADTQSVQVS